MSFEPGAKGPRRIEPDIPLRDLHGIASIGGELWCACSFDNVPSCARGKFYLVHPSGVSPEPPLDRNHINTIVERPEGIYIVAHNYGRSEVILLSRDDMTVLNRVSIGVLAHNIWFDADDMQVCSSGEGKIVGAGGLNIELGDFPRGHARSSDIQIIGVSKHSPRIKRDATNSHLTIMNGDYQEIDRIASNEEGMVLEIFAINGRVQFHEIDSARNQFFGCIQLRI